jgi:Zn-finger nucleic acid-binding protein
MSLKKCFSCDRSLDRANIYDIEVDHCPQCLGVWFEKDELRLAKDKKEEGLNWLDFDLWKDKRKFKISKGKKLCPDCRLPLYEVGYGDSKIKVDVCNICQGVWLDRGEFKLIIAYLKEKGDQEVLNNYAKNLAQEALEVFIGPETIRSEIEDFVTILGLFKHKLMAQHPKISQIILNLPK